MSANGWKLGRASFSYHQLLTPFFLPLLPASESEKWLLI